MISIAAAKPMIIAAKPTQWIRERKSLRFVASMFTGAEIQLIHSKDISRCRAVKTTCTRPICKPQMRSCRKLGTHF